MPPRTRLPSAASQAAAAPVPGLLAAPAQIKVAAFGDSLMWGQGLREADKFKNVATRNFGILAGGKPASIVYDKSRSGAKIRATDAERHDFVDIFPHLFTGQPVRVKDAFTAGTDESRASGLYGEVPSTFPTVRAQVSMLPATLGRTIDVALVDGGANDLGPEEVVNPEKHSGSQFVGAFDGLIRRIAFDDVTDLLIRVRERCPKAVVMYFGFFRPMSFRSSTSKVEALLRYELNDEVGWWLNGILDITDVNRVIHDALTRSEWLLGRWTYWTRQAVAALNRDEARRGPGFLFVPCGFGDTNSAFCSSPFLWEGYRQPAGDDAEARRIRETPRASQRANMVAVHTLGQAHLPIPPATVRSIESQINGPDSLKATMRDFAQGHAVGEKMVEQMGEEIARIQRALIASVSHPNPTGALSYADLATARLRTWHEAQERIALESSAATTTPGRPTLDQELRRYGMRGSGPVEADAGHLDVDSLAVITRTAESSEARFVPSVFLVVNTRTTSGSTKKFVFPLTFPYYMTTIQGPVQARFVRKIIPHFEPGETNRLTVDTGGTLRLTSILSCELVIGPDPTPTSPQIADDFGRTWRPESVILEVNGRQVATVTPPLGTSLGVGGRLNLSWPPASTPPATPPTVRPVVIRPR